MSSRSALAGRNISALQSLPRPAKNPAAQPVGQADLCLPLTSNRIRLFLEPNFLRNNTFLPTLYNSQHTLCAASTAVTTTRATFKGSAPALSHAPSASVTVAQTGRDVSSQRTRFSFTSVWPLSVLVSKPQSLSKLVVERACRASSSVIFLARMLYRLPANPQTPAPSRLPTRTSPSSLPSTARFTTTSSSARASRTRAQSSRPTRTARLSCTW